MKLQRYTIKGTTTKSIDDYDYTMVVEINVIADDMVEAIQVVKHVVPDIIIRVVSRT